MFRVHHFRGKMTAWIALFAVLCQALLPALAEAHDTQSPTPWAQVCGVGDITARARDDGFPAPVKKAHAEHCSLCVSALALTGATAPAVLIGKQHTLIEPAPAPARVKSHEFTSIQPRGPPAIA